MFLYFLIQCCFFTLMLHFVMWCDNVSSGEMFVHNEANLNHHDTYILSHVIYLTLYLTTTVSDIAICGPACQKCLKFTIIIYYRSVLCVMCPTFSVLQREYDGLTLWLTLGRQVLLDLHVPASVSYCRPRWQLWHITKQHIHM